MTPTQWKSFLQDYSRELLDCSEITRDLPEDVIRSGWLGFSAATPHELSQAEHRLGISLPPSLRNFYSVTNGWRTTGFFVWEVLAVTRIGWLRDLVPELYGIASEAERIPGPFKKDPNNERLNQHRLEQGTRVMRSLVISLEGDASNWLLDPGTVNDAGEWAAGHWAGWNPAMDWQADSFAALMESELETFRRLRERRD